MTAFIIIGGIMLPRETFWYTKHMARGVNNFLISVSQSVSQSVDGVEMVNNVKDS